jgi:hypothetical protein
LTPSKVDLLFVPIRECDCPTKERGSVGADGVVVAGQLQAEEIHVHPREAIGVGRSVEVAGDPRVLVEAGLLELGDLVQRRHSPGEIDAECAKVPVIVE